jgi:hypothetical protein
MKIPQLSTDIDNLINLFQSNPSKKFDYKTLEKETNIKKNLLKNFLVVLEKEGYIKVEYKIDGEYFSWNKNKKIENPSKFILKYPDIANADKKFAVYNQIENLLKEILDAKEEILKLLEIQKKLKKQNNDNKRILFYNLKIKQKKQKLLDLKTKIKKLINQLD